MPLISYLQQAQSYNILFITGEGLRIKSLRNPKAKMSKSDENIRSRIDIIDTPDQIMEKIKKSHTDTIDGISYDPDNRPGVSNLLDIQSSITGESISSICEQCISLSKVEFKTKLGEIIVEHLQPIRQEVERLLNDKGHLNNLLTEGNKKAAVISENTWKEVQKSIGFL